MSENLQYDSEPECKTTGKDSDSAKEHQVDNDRTAENSNVGAFNTLELNLNAAVTDDYDTNSEKTIDFEKQDVSSLQSSDLDIGSDADEDTMEKLAAKLSKSSVEKEKPSKIKEKEKHKHLKEKYLLVLQDDVQNKNEKISNIHPEQKKSTGIKNIKKTKFYKKRQEASTGRILNITHHRLVNPSSQLRKYYYGSTDIGKAMALVKQVSGNFDKLKVNGIIMEDFVQREVGNISDIITDLKVYRYNLQHAKVETKRRKHQRRTSDAHFVIDCL